MENILISYIGGYGDLYSVGGIIKDVYSDVRKGNKKLTISCNKEHSDYLNSLFKNIDIVVPTESFKNKVDIYPIHSKYFHRRIKKNKRLYDKLLIKNFFKIAEVTTKKKEYIKFLNKFDLIYINYLDLYTIKLLRELNKPFFIIKAWPDWDKEDKYYNVFNQDGSLGSIYYYDYSVVSSFYKMRNGDNFRDYNFNIWGYKNDPITSSFEIAKTLNVVGKKCFFSLGSMWKDYHILNKKRVLKLLDRIRKLGYTIITTHEDIPNVILLKKNLDHNYIINSVDLIIHHGGCGTTLMAKKYNVRQIIIPCQLDQFYWKKWYKLTLNEKNIYK